MSAVGVLALAHLRLVALAIGAAAAIGVPLGILATRRPRLERAALVAASLIQTVPGLALLAAMVPALAWLAAASRVAIPSIGILPAWIALTLYALLPIVRGAVLGVRAIDPAVIEAARGVGMSDRERLRIVELPLSAPSIVAGLRTATVWTVGMATLATPVGATSLGNLIFAGLQTRAYADVLAGCAAAAALAIVLDAALASLERGLASRRSRTRSSAARAAIVVSLAAALALALASVPAMPASGGRARPIRIGAKSFTEQLVLAELLAATLSPHGATEIHPSLGTTVAFDALEAGDLDVYVEYTGTAWTTILGEREPLGREAMRRAVTARLARDHRVHLVASLGFENAYALVVPGASAARRISDLGAASGLRFGGDYELFARPEWASLERAYGLSPAETRAMDPSLLYEALASGAVDVIGGYTTDGRIDALGLRALDDDRGAIPPYDAVVLVSDRFARERPDAVAALRALEGRIDAAAMRRANDAVDREGRSPEEAARALRARTVQ